MMIVNQSSIDNCNMFIEQATDWALTKLFYKKLKIKLKKWFHIYHKNIVLSYFFRQT